MSARFPAIRGEVHAIPRFALIFLGSGIGAPAAQAALDTPPAIQPKLDTNEPYQIRECATASTGVSSGFVAGRVISPTAVQMPKLSCVGPGGGDYSSSGGLDSSLGGSIAGSRGIDFPSRTRCDRDHAMRRSIWGTYCTNSPWATMNVQLANPADATKMPLGKVVALKGDFFVITQNEANTGVCEMPGFCTPIRSGDDRPVTDRALLSVAG